MRKIQFQNGGPIKDIYLAALMNEDFTNLLVDYGSCNKYWIIMDEVVYTKIFIGEGDGRQQMRC